MIFAFYEIAPFKDNVGFWLKPKIQSSPLRLSHLGKECPLWFSINRRA